jgi:hypothetical protein
LVCKILTRSKQSKSNNHNHQKHHHKSASQQQHVISSHRYHNAYTSKVINTTTQAEHAKPKASILYANEPSPELLEINNVKAEIG